MDRHKRLCDKESKDPEWKNSPGWTLTNLPKFSFSILNSFKCTYFHGGGERKERYVEVGFGKMTVKSLKHRNEETKKANKTKHNPPSPR